MFGMGRKKQHGVDLIEEVTGKFTAMIDELNEGIADCQTEQEEIGSQIDSLNQRHSMLKTSVSRATSIAANLRTLLGG